MLIVDLGQGDSTENNLEYVRELMRQLPDCVVKFQLFTNHEFLTPLDRDLFKAVYWFGRDLGLPVTASVFDEDSLEFLLKFDVPFIKIACREDLYPLLGKFPPFRPALVSVPGHINLMNVATDWMHKNVSFLSCVPEYPATREEYRQHFVRAFLERGISDHCEGIDLWREFRPKLYEKHLDLCGPDQEHSLTWDELEEITSDE